MARPDVILARRTALGRGVGVILLSSLCFGVMAVLVRVAAEKMPAAQVAWVRFTGSFLILFLTSRGRGLERRSTLGPLLLRGVLGAVAITFYFIGIGGAGAGLATLIQNTYPIFAALLASIFLHEAFTPRLGIALLLDVAGVVLIIAPGIRDASPHTYGALASFAAAMLSGGAITAARRLRYSESATVITTYFMGVGALVTAPSLLFGTATWTPELGLVLAAMTVASVAGQWLLHHGLGYTTAVQGSLSAATSVITASALESVLFGGSVHVSALLGACLMAGAVALAALSPKAA